MNKTVCLRIHGRVQGVWYRAWTADTAREFGLKGWVRNRADGTVESVLSGDYEVVQAMILRCHEGPPLAQVSNIDVRDYAEAAGDAFEVLPTI